MSLKEGSESQLMHSKSDNNEIMMIQIIGELFNYLFDRCLFYRIFFIGQISFL